MWSALRLHLVEVKRAIGREELAVRTDRPGRAVAPVDARGPHLDALSADDHPRARTGVAGAHETRQLGRRAAGVDPELVDAQLLGVRRLSALRRGLDRRDSRQLLEQQVGAQVDEARAQLAGGL